MDRLAQGLKSGRYYAVLYKDNSRESRNVKNLLDKHRIRYNTFSAKREGLDRPQVIAGGARFDYELLIDLLEPALTSRSR